MAKKANREAHDAVRELRKGLHIAMDNLITRNDKDEAEFVLRQLDARMGDWLDTTEKQ